MALTQSRVLSGGKVLIKMQGVIVGFANQMSCNDNYNLQPIHVIGQLEPLEFVPTSATHSIQMQTIMMKNDSLVRHNLEPMTVGGYGYLSSSTNNVGGVSGSLNSYSTIGTNAEAPQGDANKAELESAGRQANGGRLTLIDGKTFTIAVVDASTQKNIVEYLDCYCTGGSFSVGQNAIIGHSVQFVALDRRGQLDAASDWNLYQSDSTGKVQPSFNTEGEVFFV